MGEELRCLPFNTCSNHINFFALRLPRNVSNGHCSGVLDRGLHWHFYGVAEKLYLRSGSQISLLAIMNPYQPFVRPVKKRLPTCWMWWIWFQSWKTYYFQMWSFQVNCYSPLHSNEIFLSALFCNNRIPFQKYQTGNYGRLCRSYLKIT